MGNGQSHHGGPGDLRKAIIDLDRPIGALAGWRDYGFNDSCSWYETAGWVHRGYPSEDPYEGNIMYENGGSFDTCWSSYPLDLHYAAFDNPSWGGQSGSGSVRDGAVWAILRGSDRETVTDAALIPFRSHAQPRHTGTIQTHVESGSDPPAGREHCRCREY